MEFNATGYTEKELIHLYTSLVKPRLIEEKMLIALRQGRISKWFSSWGQEAISVGATLALTKEEYILPMHRNLGVFTSREIPLVRLFSQFQGKMNGFTKGRDRSFHFGSQEFKIVGMISHLGSQLGVADGIALGNKLKANKQAVIVFSGDGGSSQGDFHESLNTAAVWNLPVIFIIENNQWGLSTPSVEQFKCKSFVDKGIGYGIDAYTCDGNNIIEVHRLIAEKAAEIRENPRPIIIECVSFRMRGHEEASGTKYYPEGLQEEWEKKDPITNFQAYLLEKKVLRQEEIELIKANLSKEINEALDIVIDEADVIPNSEDELRDVYAPFDFKEQAPSSGNAMKIRFVDAISQAIQLAMDKHERLILMGQDIAEYGGVFKITEGLVEKYGKERVRNTPLCEAAIVGTAQGLSINGYKSMMEFQFADFVTEGFNQIINNVAKLHWRWGQQVDVVLRMPTGAGVAAGPFHSQSNEAWFAHTPGLKIIYPAFPYDAKGLLLAAFEDPNPVMFFEHKKLYRSVEQEVPVDYYTLPIGKAAKVREGLELTIITYGLGVHWVMEVLDKHPSISADLIDLRTLVPLDIDAILQSVEKTHRVLVLHEDCTFGGIGAEIVAMIQARAFEHLDAPIMRIGSLDTPIPFNAKLEDNFLAKNRLEKALFDLMEY